MRGTHPFFIIHPQFGIEVWFAPVVGVERLIDAVRRGGRCVAVHREPQPLPGSESVLFTASSTAASFEDASVPVASLAESVI